MSIDTAEKLRSISGIQFWNGPGVTPKAAKDEAWRWQVAYNYAGLVAIERSQTYVIDALLQALGVSDVYTTDIVLKAKNVQQTYFIDTLVKILGVDKTYLIDVIIGSVTFNTYVIDTLVKILDQDRTYVLDMIIQAFGISQTYVLDLLIQASNISKNYLLDILLFQQIVLSYSFDTIITDLRSIKKDITGTSDPSDSITGIGNQSVGISAKANGYLG